jgi:hypothetical protein
VAAGPEEVNQQIEFTRLQLRRDVDALVERVSPKAVAHRNIDRAQELVHQSVGRRVSAVAPVARSVREQVVRRPAVTGVVAGAVVVAGVVAAMVRSRSHR